MRRSSDSIAALAAALAKAQSELSNPEKSLVATIGADRPGEGARSFRYAPLSSGLDIVRKALGQHQIATVQTTAIDGASGIINLTTVLAHASGEWIASDWPVCRLADTASPHRMGAALTYARRYALFTLVGIAGEDDLDAPDLNGSPQTPGEGNGRTTADASNPIRHRGHGARERPVILDAHNSAALRDQLIQEIVGLDSAEQAAHWARSALSAKNRLTADDARLVQVAFEFRLSAFAVDAGRGRAENDPGSSVVPATASNAPEPSPQSAPAQEPPTPEVQPVSRRSGRARAGGVDKSVLTLAEIRRYRDKAHLKFVASRSCLVCGRKPADPHHLRFAQVKALGRKVSDEFTVPLCRLHHREVHRARNEAEWWSKLGLDAVATALRLWKMTRAGGEPTLRTTAKPDTAQAARESAVPEKVRARRRTRRRALEPAQPAPAA